MGNCCLTSDEASKISSSENHHRYSNGTHPHAATATGSASESNESPGGINLAARNKKQRRRKGRGQAPPLSHIQDRPSIEEPRAASVTSVAERRVYLPDDPDFSPSINGLNGFTLEDLYEPMGLELGKGTFGSVRQYQHKFRRDGRNAYVWHTVAVKKTAPTILDRVAGRLKTYGDIEQRCQEIKTLIRLRSTNPRDSCVLHLHEFFWNFNPAGSSELYMVTDLLGEELDQWRQRQRVFMESTARTIANVLLNAIDFMHSRQVVHRDIKLQNVLFGKNEDFRTLKIVDFGLAKCLDGDRKVKDFCGSLGYMAPEIYNGEMYGYEVDMFAFGVIIFRLLSGQRPFSSQNQEKLRRDTIDLQYSVNGNAWANISMDAQTLVRKLLIGSQERLTAMEALEHVWFRTQSESILQLDFTQTSDYQGNDDSYSQALARSHAPTETANSNRIWLDARLETAVHFLLSLEMYAGRFVNQEEIGRATDGLICLEEYTPPNAMMLPNYVASLTRYTEKDCRQLCRQIAEIIKLSHESGMAHRNIHLNNFFVDSAGNLIMRGLHYAQAVTHDQPLTGHFGYLYNWYAFKAPEIDSEFYHSKSVDLWSLGATIYMVMTGLPPFRGDGPDLILNKHAGNVVFDIIVPSRPAQELIRGLLQVLPEDRMTIDQVLNSEWMVEADDELDRFDLSISLITFQDWNER